MKNNTNLMCGAFENVLKTPYGDTVLHQYRMLEEGNRFTQLASHLSEGEFIGMQLNWDTGFRVSSFVFASSESQVIPADFRWIIGMKLETSKKNPFCLESLQNEYCGLYALTMATPDVSDKEFSDEDCISEEIEVSNLVNFLMRHEAKVRILADAAQNNAGIVLISLRGTMPLCFQTVISLAFPGIKVEKVSDEMISLGKVPRISTAYFSRMILPTLLERANSAAEDRIKYICKPNRYSYDCEDVKVLDEEEDDDDETDEDVKLLKKLRIYREGETIITRIGEYVLIPRTIHCLHRAKITDIEELRKMDYESLMKIRNLGDRGSREILDAFESWDAKKREENQDDPSTEEGKDSSVLDSDMNREDEDTPSNADEVVEEAVVRENSGEIIDEISNENSGANAEENSHENGDGENHHIRELELSASSYSILERANICNIEELKKMDYDNLIKIRNLNDKGVVEILNAVQAWEKMQEKLKRHPADRKDTDITYHMKKLDALVGLQNVKEIVKKIIAYARLKHDFSKMKRDALPLSLNMEFVGNPGTAKTTVARILAEIFHRTGITTEKDIVEVGRADLVAAYLGQTAIKIKEVFKRAVGKILFIDEAYSLVDDRDGLYGDEAIATIVQEMENNRDKIIVIFAGYPDRMKDFFDKNPGLRSRVPFRVEFKDYSDDEMKQIVDMETFKRGFALDQSVHTKLVQILNEAKTYKDAWNGRFCRNLVESAVLGYAMRFYSDFAKEPENDFLLLADDFSLPEGLESVVTKSRIGFSNPQ